MIRLKKTGIVCILFLILTLVLCACEQEAEGTVKNTSLSICTESSGKSYVSDYKDMQITPGYRPLSTSFFPLEEELYFIDTTDGLSSICRASYQKTAVPESLPIDLGEASVKALTTDSRSMQSPVVYCLAMNLSEGGFIAAFSCEGEELWRQEFDEYLNNLLLENEVFRLIQDGEGRFYALAMQRIFLFDEKGAYQGEIECPGKAFVDISRCGEEKVYTTYQQGDGGQPVLSEVRFRERTLAEEKRVLGNGSLGRGMGNTLLFCDGSAVYSCEPETESIVRLLEFADYDIIGKDVRTIVQLADGKLITVCFDIQNLSAPVELISFRETQKQTVEKDGKKVITFLCIDNPLMNEQYAGVIADFNKQSKEYKVVLEGIAMTDDIGKDAFFASANTRLAAKESADLFYIFDYRDIERYQSKGYLEDLAPYLEKSELIKEEDYIEGVLECFEVSGGLYGMSVSFSIDTLAGKATQLGNKAGWTVEEFLDWLKNNPKVKSESGLTKTAVLEYCLKGNLEAYVDWEEGRAFCEEEIFEDLLATISVLDTDDHSHYDNWSEILGQEEPILEQLYIGNCVGYNLYKEISYGDKMVYVGYPGSGNMPKYYLDTGCLSILSRSSCKEGAFAFVEFYMNYKRSSGTYYTKKADYEASMAEALEGEITIFSHAGEEETVPTLTEEGKEKQEQLLKHAVADTLEAQTVRGIILEEAQAYFQGDKELSETCRIIQSRVQLYMDERR